MHSGSAPGPRSPAGAAASCVRCRPRAFPGIAGEQSTVGARDVTLTLNPRPRWPQTSCCSGDNATWCQSMHGLGSPGWIVSMSCRPDRFIRNGFSQATQPDDDLPDMTKTRRELLAKAVEDSAFVNTIAKMAEHFKSVALDDHECFTCGRPLSAAELPAFMTKQVPVPPSGRAVSLSLTEEGSLRPAVCLSQDIAALGWQPKQLHLPLAV